MNLEFVREGNELILIYHPETIDGERILQELKEGKSWSIKRCFAVTAERIRSHTAEYDVDDDSLFFCIGVVGAKYTYIDSGVVGTENRIYFANEIHLTEKMFIASYHISILRTLDKVANADIYTGDSSDRKINLPLSVFAELIRKFPKTAEMRHYTYSRISRIIKEYFGEAERYEKRFQKFLENRSKSVWATDRNAGFLQHTKQVELAQFKLADEELRYLLDNAEGMTENEWQEKIHNVIRLLYPKYIAGIREVTIRGVDGYDKRPDFLLIDANGFIDIMEIKKPGVQLLTKQSSYRNNYVPVRELAGTIQQIEKYVFCMNNWGKDGEASLTKELKDALPENISPKIVNPQGILVLGRSNDFNPQQRNDFELIKRQYKHITDIMSYDDLVTRIRNIIAALEMSI
ncbi:Shedu immune nuclease family protein [Scatolibacter rhodanostii]|uniref:Shedu immune nuclease family protein n=1 Tax=Scatolibacter rhodanostii TaxID=2014781 RepID=UPI000C07229A|nr:Shedu immune nuclease family protein [Scatolibacter rhodanostii]